MRVARSERTSSLAVARIPTVFAFSEISLSPFGFHVQASGSALPAAGRESRIAMARAIWSANRFLSKFTLVSVEKSDSAMNKPAAGFPLPFSIAARFLTEIPLQR